jgi:four helix bundle protein
MSRPHHDLDAWKEAMRMVKMVYQLSQQFPKEEVYGLTSQVRRAAVSVPSNLSEGAARSSKKEFSHFLSVAKGSLSELETQLIISADLGYFPVDHDIFAHMERVAQLLGGLHRKISQ